jgi:hypothetical protein
MQEEQTNIVEIGKENRRQNEEENKKIGNL